VDGFTLLDLDALRDGDLVQATPRQPQPPQPQPLGLDEASIGRLTVASRHIAAAACVFFTDCPKSLAASSAAQALAAVLGAAGPLLPDGGAFQQQAAAANPGAAVERTLARLTASLNATAKQVDGDESGDNEQEAGGASGGGYEPRVPNSAQVVNPQMGDAQGRTDGDGGGTQTGRTPSRSARRKAIKRRLRREGLLPYRTPAAGVFSVVLFRFPCFHPFQAAQAGVYWGRVFCTIPYSPGVKLCVGI
jgi:hypothetical protein